MTSNQLQYASNQISQQMADETGRHNEETEAEIKRHNSVLEGIQQEANDIERLKAEYNKELEQNKQWIQQQYNDAYLALQKAQGDEANRIKAQLADIDSQKVYWDNLHNIRMDDISDKLAALKLRSQEEDERHNVAMEDYYNTMNLLTKQKQGYEERYQKGMLAYYNGILADRELQTTHNYILGTQNITLGTQSNTLKAYELQFEMQKWGTQSKEIESRIINNVLSGAESLVTTASNAVGSFVLGGLNMQKGMFGNILK